MHNMEPLLHSHYTCQSLVLIRVLKLQLQAVTPSEDVVPTWLEENNEKKPCHLSPHRAKTRPLCVFLQRKTHLTVHTEAARSMVFSLVQTFTLREGWCAFRFVKYFNTKVDSCPVRSISALAVPQASYLWSMLTFEICGHTAGQVIDPHCQRRRVSCMWFPLMQPQ